MGTLTEHYKSFGAVPAEGKNPWTGEGWTNLIYACHDELVPLDLDYIIVQIKEKFGGLRYYFSSKSGTDIWNKLNEVTRKYENLSFKTCEFCGEPGESSNGNHGWIKTTCLTCSVKHA